MAGWYGPSGDCGCNCGSVACPDSPDACQCFNGTSYIDKPDYEITISGVTNPSSPYITCAACSSFFNRTVTLSCGDSYENPSGLSYGVICSPSSPAITCGLGPAKTFGILGVISIIYGDSSITLSMTSIVGYVSGLGYNTTGGSTQTFAAELTFDTRICTGANQPGQLCTTTRESDVASTGLGVCTETDDMVCGVANASVSFTAV